MSVIVFGHVVTPLYSLNVKHALSGLVLHVSHVLPAASGCRTAELRVPVHMGEMTSTEHLLF